MNKDLNFSSNDAIQIQRFAEQSLEEISKRAKEDGMDLLGLHSAICVGAVGWLTNHVGSDRTSEMLTQLAAVIKDSNLEDEFNS